jgi:hypothetical protein
MKTIGTDLTITGYSVKQKGYGRQGLYLRFLEVENGKDGYYVQDVFPNVIEHFDILLENDAFLRNRDSFGRFCKPYFTDGNGNGHYDKYYYSIAEYLTEYFEGTEIEIDEEDEE